MNWLINACALLAFLGIMFLINRLSVWGVDAWGAWIAIPGIAIVLFIAWLMDRSGKFRH